VSDDPDRDEIEVVKTGGAVHVPRGNGAEINYAIGKSDKGFHVAFYEWQPGDAGNDRVTPWSKQAYPTLADAEAIAIVDLRREIESSRQDSRTVDFMWGDGSEAEFEAYEQYVNKKADAMAIATVGTDHLEALAAYVERYADWAHENARAMHGIGLSGRAEIWEGHRDAALDLIDRTRERIELAHANINQPDLEFHR